MWSQIVPDLDHNDGVIGSLSSLFSAFKEDHTRILDYGMLKIVSALEYGSDRQLVHQDGEAPELDVFMSKVEKDEAVEVPTGYIKPFRPNFMQGRILDVRAMFRKMGYKFDPNNLKSRGDGLTTVSQACLVSSALVESGIQNITIAHAPASTATAYRIGREMIRNVDPWLRPTFENDSKELITIHNPQWGVTRSFLRCIAATNINAIRGERAMKLVLDEVGYFDNPNEVSAALSELSIKSKNAEVWKNTTANGEDDYFHPEFMAAWIKQGQRNPWERGVRLFRHPTVSMFFPFYLNPTKTLDLPAWVTYEWLLKDLDEYEKWLLKTGLLPLWIDQGFSDSEALKASLRQLFWRRCKIRTEYTHMDKPPFIGNQVATLLLFNREEPASVEEAFSTSVGDCVVPLHVRDRLRAEHIQDPEAIGRFEDFEFRTTDSRGDDQDEVWLFKHPKEVKGSLVLCVDTASGVYDNDQRGGWDLRKDLNWATLWEVAESGVADQVAELVTQDPAYVFGPKLFALAKFYHQEERGDDGLPFLAPETAMAGINIVHYFLNEKEYPPHRIYRRTEDDRVGRQPMAKWGFATGDRTKANAVRYLLERLVDDRIIIRSARLLKQFNWFVEKKNNKFEARGKGKGGMFSKDDGVITAAILAYVLENSALPQGSDLSGFTAKNLVKPENWMADGTIQAWRSFVQKVRETGVDPSSVPTQKQVEYGRRRNWRLLR